MAVSGSRHVTSCTGCLCETSLTHVGTWLPLPCPCLILCWSTATRSISSHWSPRPPLLMTSGRLVLPPGHQLAFSPPPNTDFLSCCKEFVSKMLTTFALLSTFFPTNLFTEKILPEDWTSQSTWHAIIEIKFVKVLPEKRWIAVTAKGVDSK